jgi:subtilisin family serine protease
MAFAFRSSFAPRQPLFALSGLLSAVAALALAFGTPPNVVRFDPVEQADAVIATATASSRSLSTLTGASQWHTGGYRGQGLTVAVLDSGFRGWKQFLGGALPSDVTVKSFRHDGNFEAKDSQHGILCGEVVHALAPDARLIFANWEPDDPQSFLDAVRWARERGARVITTSVISPSWGDGEGGGPVHAALRAILGDGKQAGDVLCFACAGNTAQRTWSGTFTDAGAGRHAWAAGVTDNALSPWGDERVSVEMVWHGPTTYELQVVDGGEVIGTARGRGGDKPGSAVVRFEPKSGQSYQVRVRKLDGPAGRFHVVGLSAYLAHYVTGGSITFPGDGAEVVTVGAVSPDGERAAYSSCGDSDAPPKPDLVAPVPFVSRTRARPFAGTSAATPQAAALAALTWARHPNWTAGQVRRALCESARDLGPVGFDRETGYGLVRLPIEQAAAR